jgi:thiamine pyrophosphokinase
MEFKVYDLLICNGDMPDKRFCQEIAKSAHMVLCADGGANKAYEHGISPASIVGDLDSITPAVLNYYRERDVEIIHLERQDDTDFEKALKLMLDRGTTTLVVLGLTGGLLDHTLGNLSILQRYINSLNITLFDPNYRIDIITRTTTFAASTGSRVSIVPLQSATGVAYEGLLYQLPRTTLSNGSNEGTCNEATADEFTVKMSSGVLMVFRELHADLLAM